MFDLHDRDLVRSACPWRRRTATGPRPCPSRSAVTLPTTTTWAVIAICPGGGGGDHEREGRAVDDRDGSDGSDRGAAGVDACEAPSGWRGDTVLPDSIKTVRERRTSCARAEIFLPAYSRGRVQPGAEKVPFGPLIWTAEPVYANIKIVPRVGTISWPPGGIPVPPGGVFVRANPGRIRSRSAAPSSSTRQVPQAWLPTVNPSPGRSSSPAARSGRTSPPSARRCRPSAAGRA